VKKSFNIRELLHPKSKGHGTKPMHPSSSRAFERHHEHNLKHLNSVDLITTKRKKDFFLIRKILILGIQKVWPESKVLQVPS